MCLWLLFGHYYSSSTQVMISVTARSDIFLSHLTNTDMKYVISYASVLVPHSSFQLQLLLNQYEIYGLDQSHQGCSTYIQMHCECSCAL